MRFLQIDESFGDMIGEILTCGEQCQHDLKIFDFTITSVMVLLSIIFSIFFVRKHLTNYTNPFFQDKIIVILFMSPFYAITSFLSILTPFMADYLALFRDIYEALLLFTFFYLMFAYLAYDEKTKMIDDYKVKEELVHVGVVHHRWPVGACVRPYKLTNHAKGKYFIYRCKKFILQFLVIKPGSALLLIIMSFFHGNHMIETVMSTIEWIVMFSISFSLYFLILFYDALKKPLAPYRPLMKFLVVKITLFFTFWQKIALAIMEETILDFFDKTAKSYDAGQILKRLENTLVCLEMLLLSIAGGFAFTYKDFAQGEKIQGNFKNVIIGNWNSFQSDFRLIKPKARGFKAVTATYEIEQKPLDPKVYEEFSIELKDLRPLEKNLLTGYT